jgi:hypothetical protein
VAVCYKYFFKGNSVQNRLSNQVFFMKQRHNIFKKRLDPSGKEIAAPKADFINRPKIGKPLQRHGGSLEENEKYCGSCYGAEMSDDQCCNSCEDVREAYRQKGWAIGDPEIIDQVFMIRSASGYWSFLSTTSAHFLLVGDKLNLVIMLLSPSCKYSKSWVCWVAVQKGGIFAENQRGGW